MEKRITEQTPAPSAAPPIDIPFNKPFVSGPEFDYMRQAIAFLHMSGDGSFTRRCQQLIAEILSAPRVLLTTSCTHALEMAALLLDLQPGDEVIVPSFTFVSTANAFALHGARPVFVDVRSDTLNLDERLLPELLTERTRAIVPVHYAGVGCDMDAILAVSRKHGIAVVEDNAHGFLGGYRGRLLGTFGEMATLSFHETKNITCGEGGALVINDLRLIERAEIVREKGTNRSRFFRGQVDRYTWVGLGSSYAPSDILAAYLLAQLERRDAIQQKRERIWKRYAAELAEWAAQRGVRLPVVPTDRGHSFHMFHIITPSLEFRQALIAHLRKHGILAVFHYQPLHSSEMGLRMGGGTAHCPVTEELADRLLRLPFYNALTGDEQRRVIEAVRSFSGG